MLRQPPRLQHRYHHPLPQKGLLAMSARNVNLPLELFSTVVVQKLDVESRGQFAAVSL